MTEDNTAIPGIQPPIEATGLKPVAEEVELSMDIDRFNASVTQQLGNLKSEGITANNLFAKTGKTVKRGGRDLESYGLSDRGREFAESIFNSSLSEKVSDLTVEQRAKLIGRLNLSDTDLIESPLQVEALQKSLRARLMIEVVENIEGPKNRNWAKEVSNIRLAYSEGKEKTISAFEALDQEILWVKGEQDLQTDKLIEEVEADVEPGWIKKQWHKLTTKFTREPREKERAKDRTKRKLTPGRLALYGTTTSLAILAALNPEGVGNVVSQVKDVLAKGSDSQPAEVDPSSTQVQSNAIDQDIQAALDTVPESGWGNWEKPVMAPLDDAEEMKPQEAEVTPTVEATQAPELTQTPEVVPPKVLNFGIGQKLSINIPGMTEPITSTIRPMNEVNVQTDESLRNTFLGGYPVAIEGNDNMTTVLAKHSLRLKSTGEKLTGQKVLDAVDEGFITPGTVIPFSITTEDGSQQEIKTVYVGEPNEPVPAHFEGTASDMMLFFGENGVELSPEIDDSDPLSKLAGLAETNPDKQVPEELQGELWQYWTSVAYSNLTARQLDEKYPGNRSSQIIEQGGNRIVILACTDDPRFFEQVDGHLSVAARRPLTFAIVSDEQIAQGDFLLPPKGPSHIIAQEQ